jgi:hypothetical protein
VRFRREPEDILLDAGAAVVNLPDFHGPEVHVNTLQQALVEAVAGKRMCGAPASARSTRALYRRPP